jgi:8-oxo-dGTP diphosphatase
LLAEAPDRVRTTPAVIVRHAQAVPRAQWPHDDDHRPLDATGNGQAIKLATAFNAFGATACVSSDAKRCIDTVRPWADGHDIDIQLRPGLSESGFSPDDVVATATELRGVPAVACSHRPVLPHLLASFGLDELAGLRVGEFIVAHRHGDDVIASERHWA